MKIVKWLEERGCTVKYSYVVDSIFIEILSKLSDECLEEFKKDFGCDLHLRGASFNKYGHSDYFSYECYPSELHEFGLYLSSWLKNHHYSGYAMIFLDGIKITIDEELSAGQIRDFEEEFGVRCSGYSMECDLNKRRYEFKEII